MSSLSAKKRKELKQASKEAAAALLEDAEHIRQIMAQRNKSRSAIRLLSGILRRLLIERDIAIVAAPRMGRIELLAPDNSFFYKLADYEPVELFASGGASHFGHVIRPVIIGEDRRNRDFGQQMAQFIGEADRTTILRLERFLSQKVMCLHNQWVSRHDVIEFVCYVASGVHSGQPDTNEKAILAHIRNAFIISAEEGGGFSITMATSKMLPNLDSESRYLPQSIDIVLHELLSAAHYLLLSPDLTTLERIVLEELSPTPAKQV